MKKFSKIALTFSLIMAAFVLYVYEPVQGGIYPPCPFRYITHYYCPGCGSLRALNSLLHGHILRALDFNPLMVLSIPFIIYLTLANLQIKINGKPLIKIPIFSRKFYSAILTIIIGYWILRNINIYPFTILAP